MGIDDRVWVDPNENATSNTKDFFLDEVFCGAKVATVKKHNNWKYMTPNEVSDSKFLASWF